MALPNESRRAPGRGRRPEDAPHLSAVPSAPGLELPGVLAQAVKDASTREDTAAPAPESPTAPDPEPEPDPGPGSEVEVADGQTAADVQRSIRWLGVTYRPPDVWRERQPSLAEEWEFVMRGSHLPESDLWRAAARGYAAPALGVMAALHLAIWVLRSPARHATAWVLAAVAVVTAVHIV